MDYRVECSQVVQDKDNPSVGYARVTVEGWDPNHPMQIAESHSCEIKLKFDPSTKKFEIDCFRQWEGKF